MSPTKRDNETAQDSIKPDFLNELGIAPDEQQQMENDAYSGAADDIADNAGLSNTDLYRAESNSAKSTRDAATTSDKSEGDELDNSLYTGADKKGVLGRVMGNKRGKWIGAGVGTSIIGLGISGFIMLPLKVMHISENLQSTFFSSSEQAAEDMSNRLFTSYLVQKVLPGMNGTCTSTLRDKSCAVVDDSSNYVSQLYRAWRDNNLEGKLAERHGIEIQKRGNNFRLIVGKATITYPGADGGQNSYESKMWKDLTSRKEVRREINKALEKETFYKRIMYRYKYGSLMERKYGIIRCVIACDYRQDRADRKELRKMRYKAWVIQRVVGPLNEGYSLAFQCAVTNFDCAKESSSTVDEDGTKKTKFENELRQATKTAIGDGRMTKERLAEMQKNADDIKNNGLANHLLKKVFGEAGGKIAGGTIAGAGLVDLLAKLVAGITDAGPAIKAMNYALKTGAAVQVYSMYRTNADEIKDGKSILNAEEVGYVAESLGDGFGTDQGGGSAEAAPYYSDVMGSRGVNTASLSLFPKAAAAAPYKCDDGTTIASGFCPEMSVAATTSGANTINSLSDFFKSSGLSDLASIWNSTIGKAFDGLNNVIGFITDPIGDLAGKLTPGFIKDNAAGIAKSLGRWFTEKLFINFMTENPSGGRMFEAAALGANVAGNDYAHYGLGAGKISDQAANNIRYARAIEAQEEFEQQSFFARMFDTSNTYSMTSKLALATPSGSNGLRSVASSLLNPFKTVAYSLPTAKKVDAAPKKNLDLGGITQYGYTGAEDIFKNVTDYEAYWDEHSCDDENQLTAWGESAKMSDVNGSYENDTPYPCKLLKSAASMNCGYYDDSCLEPNELGSELENVCTEETAGLNVEGLPEWAKMPAVDAPIGGAVNGSINAVAVNAKFKDTFPTVLREITSQRNPDFVALNEIYNEDIPGIVKKTVPQYDAWREPTKDNTKGANTGQSMNNAIMWKKDKWELLDSGRVKVIDDDQVVFDGKQRTWDRFAIWGVFKRKSDGAIVSFVSTHMPTNPSKQKQWGNQPFSRQEQYGQGMDILIQLTKVLGQHGPVIVGGDMNTHGDEGNWAAIPKMQAAGFKHTSEVDVLHIFTPAPTKITDNRAVYGLPLKNDHHNGAEFAKIEMNGAGPTSSNITLSETNFDCAKTGTTDYINAVYKDSAPDPSIIEDSDGTYHVYATGNVHLTSKDMVNWKKAAGGWNIKNAPNLAGGHKWAPDVAKIGSKYVFTYTIPSGTKEIGGGGPPKIGYAIGNSAGGPFVFKGILDLSGPYNIDSHIFVDDNGKAWLFYGGGYIKVIQVKLDGDKLKTVGGAKDLLSKGKVGSSATIEGAYVTKHDGWYYLTYSQGHYKKRSGPPEYRVLVARSRKADGPFKPDDSMKPILEGKGNIRFPGHHSIITDKAGKDWIVYHGYYKNENRVRSLNIDPIEYEDGWPKINDGYPSSTKRTGPTTQAGDSSGGAASVPGWSWPLKANINNGPCYGGSSVHAGMDMNSSTTNNVVYAMHSGEVVATGSGGAAGNYVTILANKNFNGKPVYYSYEHLKDGSLKVRKGDKVQGGAPIGIAGTTGNVSLGSSKAHLHIVTATTNTLGSYGNLGTTFDPMKILGSVKPAPGGYKCY